MNKQRAEALADIFQQIADLQLEAKALIDEAKEAGENTKALRKVAKELITDSAKLEKLYDDELQIDLFREAVQIHKRKGIGSASNSAGETRHDMGPGARHLDG